MAKKRKGFKKPPPKVPAADQKAMTPSGDAPAPAQAAAPAMTDEARMNSRYGGED
jgi:hypothetical protein